LANRKIVANPNTGKAMKSPTTGNTVAEITVNPRPIRNKSAPTLILDILSNMQLFRFIWNLLFTAYGRCFKSADGIIFTATGVTTLVTALLTGKAIRAGIFH
jgi:hypothetical protein